MNIKNESGILMMKIKENINNVDEFNLLYDLVGWGAYDKEISKKSFNNTYYSVSVYDNNKIVGYGRLIGDGICFMYIHDVMVAPNSCSACFGIRISDIKVLNTIYDYLLKKHEHISKNYGDSKLFNVLSIPPFEIIDSESLNLINLFRYQVELRELLNNYIFYRSQEKQSVKKLTLKK